MIVESSVRDIFFLVKCSNTFVETILLALDQVIIHENDENSKDANQFLDLLKNARFAHY